MGQKDELLAVVHELAQESLVLLDEICKTHDIVYYMRGGSALGAVKYGGFVPWDDDIDIVVPRESYERLIFIMPKVFGGKFQFVSYQKYGNSYCYVPRVILSEEYCDAHCLQKNNIRGISLLDVAPLDGFPESPVAQKMYITRALGLRALASLWTIDADSAKSTHDSSMQSILNLMYKTRVYKLYKQNDIYRELDRLYTSCSYGATEYASAFHTSKAQKEIVPFSWWGNGALRTFNDLQVRVPLHYDEYLSQLFGADWKTCEPPERERTKSHLYGRA